MKKIITILAITSVFVSCQKVINVDINNTTPQIVIEANMSNDSSAAEVKISNTINFSESKKFVGVSNAIVSITDEAGIITNLNEVEKGIYKSTPQKFASEKTYRLKVIADNKVYESTSTMPAVTRLDSIITFPNTFGKGVILVPTYFDAPGVKNYYRFIAKINDTISKDLNINDDKFNDGIYAQQPLFVRGSNGNSKPIYKGDKATVEMQCITAAEYLYWFSLQQNEQSTPANPTTNITGGALGYFSTHASSIKTIIVN